MVPTERCFTPHRVSCGFFGPDWVPETTTPSKGRTIIGSPGTTSRDLWPTLERLKSTQGRRRSVVNRRNGQGPRKSVDLRNDCKIYPTDEEVAPPWIVFHTI